MSNINTFLTKIQTLNKENIIDVDVPSLSGTVKFLPLSVKQQKDLIKSSLDGSLAGIYINNTINNIILENNIDKHQLLVIDKLPIIVALRVQAFGSTYQVNEQDVELSIILSNKLTFKNKLTQTVKYKDVFAVELKIPTLETDSQVNNSLVQTYKNNNNVQISDIASELYVFEITKFIQSITINSETIEFDTINNKEKYQIVEQLPVQLNQLILDYISSFRVAETQYLTINGVELSIDTQFFTKE